MGLAALVTNVHEISDKASLFQSLPLAYVVGTTIFPQKPSAWGLLSLKPGTWFADLPWRRVLNGCVPVCPSSTLTYGASWATRFSLHNDPGHRSRTRFSLHNDPGDLKTR